MRPPIAYAFINLNKAVMENKGKVSSKLKRLIGYLTSTVTGCNYCRAHTIRAAERYGSNTEQLNEIWDFRESKNFDKKEKAWPSEAKSIDEVIPDKVTKSMKSTIDETNRRRKIQDAYNKKNNIIPKTVNKSKENILAQTTVANEKETINKFVSNLEIDPVIKNMSVNEIKKICLLYTSDAADE